MIARWVLGLGLAGAAAGCTPTCGQMCDKLDGCKLTTSIERDECRESCEAQLADLQSREYTGPLDRFNEQRMCVGVSTCDELVAGTCWDPSLSPYGLGEG